MPDPLQDLAISVLWISVILLGTFFVVRLFRTVVRRLWRNRAPGLIAILQQFGSWSIWIIGVIIALRQIQVDVTILLLIMGLGGLAILLAYQGVLSDIAAAQFIPISKPFKVGEWIEVQDHYGRVIEVDLTHTKLLTQDNEIVIIPNSSLLRQSIVNRTRSGGLRVQIPVFVKRGADLMEVEGKLLEISNEIKVELSENSSPQVRVLDVTREGARLALLLEIANPAKRDMIISDVHRRVYDLLHAHQ